MSFITESRKAYKQIQEAEDHEISMARGELEAIADKATQLASMLQGKSDEGNPLEAWVQSKITKAKDYINSVSDYMMYNPKINESYELEETTFEKIYQMQQDGKSVEDIAKELNLKADLVKKVLGESKVISEGLTDAQIAQLKKEYGSLKNKTITVSQYQQLKNLLFKLHDGDLEKLQKQNIPFASTGAGSILRVRKSPVKITNVTVPGLEGMAEGAKRYREMSNVGTAKYTVSFHDGIKKHNDGSDFFDMQIFKNKEEKNKFINDLEGKGYRPVKVGEEVEKMAEENDYVAVHTKGKVSVTANTSYEAAKKAAEKLNLKGTAGITVMLSKKDGEDVVHKATEEVQLKEKPVDAKDVIKTIKDLRIDDLKVNDDKNFIHIVKEFDPTIDKLDDVKSEYMDIVKTLNQKGINYKPNASQDIEKDQEYIQINFSVKKEAVDNPYAIGMAAAMKATGDTPPLKKSTITKAHKIADKVKEEVEKMSEEKSLFDDNHPNGGQGKSISEIEQMLKKEIQKGNFIGSNSYTVIEPGLTHFKQDQTITHKELLNNIKRYGANQFATLPDATFGEEVKLTELDSKRKRELKDRLNKLQYEKHFNHDANKEDLQKKIDDLKKQIEAVKEEVSKEKETEFHKKLDTLVHKTFGKRKDEKAPVKESHFSMGQHVIFKGPKNPITPIKAQIIKLEPPYTGAYYQIKKADGEITYASPDQLELDEACWTGYKQVGLKKKGKRMVPNCVKEEKRLYIESIVAVKNKAEKSGMPYSILKQVYDRGMAAWKGGHRPGATQVQWALARVNSFVTKSSGTWGGADSDLAKKVKG